MMNTKFWILIGVCFLAARADVVAQGTANFANAGAGFQARMTYEGQPLTGSDWVVQLYVGMDYETLAPVNSPIHFSDKAAGFFFGGVMEIPGFAAGSTVPAAQVRAWDLTTGMTYELSDVRTESNVFEIGSLGGGISIPASLSGMDTSYAGQNSEPPVATVPEEPAPVQADPEPIELIPVADGLVVGPPGSLEPEDGVTVIIDAPVMRVFPGGSTSEVIIFPGPGQPLPGMGAPIRFGDPNLRPIISGELIFLDDDFIRSPRAFLPAESQTITFHSSQDSGGSVTALSMNPTMGLTYSAASSGFSAVPEPGTITLFLLGLAGLALEGVRRRSRR